MKLSIEAAYDETVKWRRNLFSLPKGNIGKKFIDEKTRLINHWTSTKEEEALNLLFIMPNLLLFCCNELRENEKLAKTKIICAGEWNYEKTRNMMNSS